MRLASVTAVAILLAGCASAPSGLSFNERLEAKALAQIEDDCAGKAGEYYDRCALDVRREVLAQSRGSFPNAANRGNDNPWPTSAENVASN